VKSTKINKLLTQIIRELELTTDEREIERVKDMLDYLEAVQLLSMGVELSVLMEVKLLQGLPVLKAQLQTYITLHNAVEKVKEQYA